MAYFGRVGPNHAFVLVDTGLYKLYEWIKVLKYINSRANKIYGSRSRLNGWWRIR